MEKNKNTQTPRRQFVTFHNGEENRLGALHIIRLLTKKEKVNPQDITLTDDAKIKDEENGIFKVK